MLRNKKTGIRLFALVLVLLMTARCSPGATYRSSKGLLIPKDQAIANNNLSQTLSP